MEKGPEPLTQSGFYVRENGGQIYTVMHTFQGPFIFQHFYTVEKGVLCKSCFKRKVKQSPRSEEINPADIPQRPSLFQVRATAPFFSCGSLCLR